MAPSARAALMLIVYCVFGRSDGTWKLEEVLSPAKGEEAVTQENVDADSNAA